MHTKAVSLFIGATLVSLLLSAPAGAATPTLTKKAAVRGVEREARANYDLRAITVGCKRLTRTRMKCKFDGLTGTDIREGRTGGHRGIAYVRRYSRSIDVRITTYQKGHYF